MKSKPLMEFFPEVYATLNIENNPGVDLESINSGCQNTRFNFSCPNPSCQTLSYTTPRIAVTRYKNSGTICLVCKPKPESKEPLITTNEMMDKEFEPSMNSGIDKDTIRMDYCQEVGWMCRTHKGCKEHRYYRTPKEKLKYPGCVYCLHHRGRICTCDSIVNHPDIVKYFRQELNPNIDLTKLHKGSLEKVNFMCTAHKGCPPHFWTATIKGMLNSKIKCEVCRHENGVCCPCESFKVTHPEIYEDAEDVNPGVDLTRISSGSGRRLRFRCREHTRCGTHIWCVPLSWRTCTGNGCPKCRGHDTCECLSFMNNPKLAKEFIPCLNVGKKDPWTVSVSSQEKYNWMCQVCGHIWRRGVADRSRQTTPGCLECSGLRRRTIDEYIERSRIRNCEYVGVLVGETYVLDIPQNTNYHCFLKCIDCKHIFKSRYDAFSGCPLCRNKTEKKMNSYLRSEYSDLTITFQYRPKWSVNPVTNMSLPFDFMLSNGTTNIIIELDGKQHFRQVWNWRSPEEEVSRDVLKMNFAFENNHKFIRILQDDVYYDKNDWKRLLDAAIRNLIRTPAILIFLSDCYGPHLVPFINDLLPDEDDSEFFEPREP
jgi:very-short-patch-repair endonuclease